MKPSKLFITSLLAAAAMSATTYASGLGGATERIDGTTATVSGTYTYNADNATGYTPTDASVTKVVFNGFTGLLDHWTGGVFAYDIELTNSGTTAAFKVNNGSSDGYIAFSGALTGTGTFTTNDGNPGKYSDWIFTGNIQGFNGAFNLSNATMATGDKNIGGSRLWEGILQFGGTVSGSTPSFSDTATSYSSAATVSDDGIVHNISGTNQSTISTASVLRYSYTGGANGETLGIDNASISARYLEFKGGANYTVSSTVTGNNTTAANNTLKISAGTTTFTGAVSGFGNVTVASGAALSIGSTGSLDISKGALSAAGNISIAGLLSAKIGGTNAPISISAGNLSVTDTATFALLGDGAFGESVVLASITGSGTVTAATLSKEKFTYNGHALSSRVTGVSLTESGSLAFTGKALSLTWKSDLTTGTWNKRDQNFTASDGTASSFVDYDDVTFATADASVTIGEAIGAEKITISENTTFSASSTNTLSASSVAVESGTLTLNGGISSYSFGSVNIAENATLKAIVLPAGSTSAEPTENATVDYSGVTGTGTLTLGLRNDNGVGFNLSNFTGTIRVEGNTATTRGRLQLNTSTLNSAAQIVVANTGDLVFNGSGTNISNTVTFEGSSSIYVNSGKTGTLSGSLTATSGTLTKEGAGALTLSGSTDINKLIINNIGSVTYSAGTHTLGSISASEKTLTVSGASLTISGAATIGEVRQTDGTLNFTGANATIDSYMGPTARGGGTNPVTNVAAGANLNVTGEFYLRYEGNGTSTLNVDGNMLVGGALNLSRDGKGIVNVRGGGTLVAASIGFGQNWDGTSTKSSVVNLASGGTLVAGAMTKLFNNINSSSLNLNGGVLGTTAESLTISVDSLPIVLGRGTTSTINTGKYDTATKTFTDREAAISIVNAISGDGALKKAGAGTLTLSGDNLFSGGLEIKEGIVVSTRPYSLGSASNVVKIAGGQLKVNAGVTLAQTNVEIALGSAYANTESGVAAIIGAAATASLADNTVVTITKLDLAGIALASEAALANSSYEFKILDTISAGEGLTFKLSEALENDWRISDYTNGVLTIAAIPEPSMFGLLAGLGALALAGTRRRRRKA